MFSYKWFRLSIGSFHVNHPNLLKVWPRPWSKLETVLAWLQEHLAYIRKGHTLIQKEKEKDKQYKLNVAHICATVHKWLKQSLWGSKCELNILVYMVTGGNLSVNTHPFIIELIIHVYVHTFSMLYAPFYVTALINYWERTVLLKGVTYLTRLPYHMGWH